MKKPIRAALYVRVPRNIEGRVHIQGHINTLKEYCLGKGYAIDDSRIYTDIGSAQLPISERPGYQKLLDDSSDRKFSKVVLRDLRSIARRLPVFIEFQTHMDHFGVGVESLVDEYNSAIPSGRLMSQIISSIAGLERGLIKSRRNFACVHDNKTHE
jgi:site-specific DNA recombinase